MAFWNKMFTEKTQKLVGFGGGINTFNDPLSIKEDELTDCLNICSDNYPIVRTRNDRTLSALPATTSKVYGAGQRFGLRGYNAVHVLTSDHWICANPDGFLWSTVGVLSNVSYCKFVEFNTQTDKYTICAISYDSSSSPNFNYAYTSNSTALVSLSSDSPQTALYTAHKYRLYAMGIDKRTLFYTAQGTINDWVTAGDAGYIDITEIKGKATAITTYADHVIIWSENSMHELYGTYSENYELINLSNSIGCVSLNAYVESNGSLYWLDYSGIYMYKGGRPQQVAHEAKKYIDGINWDYKDLIITGTINGKLYFAIPYKTTSINKIIVVDTKHTDQYGNPQYIITIEDGNWVGFANYSETLYGVNSTSSSGYIYNMWSTRQEGFDGSTTGTAFSWSFETRPLTDPDINLVSAIKDIWIEHQGTTSATMYLKYTTNTNSTTFTSFANSSDFTHSTNSVRDRLLPTSTQLESNPFVKFQFSGTGHKRISGMKLNIISWGEMG